MALVWQWDGAAANFGSAVALLGLTAASWVAAAASLQAFQLKTALSLSAFALIWSCLPDVIFLGWDASLNVIDDQFTYTRTTNVSALFLLGGAAVRLLPLHSTAIGIRCRSYVRWGCWFRFVRCCEGTVPVCWH